MSVLSDSINRQRYMDAKGHNVIVMETRDILKDRKLVVSKKLKEIEDTKEELDKKVKSLEELFSSKK